MESFPLIKSDAGTACVIYSTRAGGKYPVHGAYNSGSNEWIATAWTSNGEHFQGRSSGLDITKAVANGEVPVEAQG
jgi:hypothetical protein